MRARHYLAVAPLFAFLLTACSPQAEKDDPASPFVRGTARVISVDQTLGRVVLDYQNRQVEAFWQTDVNYAQGGSLAKPDNPLKPPVGVYREPTQQIQTFDAKPGETIQFMGMRTGRSIFLQGVAVVH
jgi:hypothetical protein